jgi:hypothetical protein
VRRLTCEEAVDEALAPFDQLALGERPHVDIVHAPGKRVGDARQREDVRGARQQELSALVVAFQSLLDRQHQIGRSLNLVDHGRTRDPRDESGRVLQSRPIGE